MTMTSATEFPVQSPVGGGSFVERIDFREITELQVSLLKKLCNFSVYFITELLLEITKRFVPS